MPANPIQRKSRNSFFLGVLVMLIIAIVVAGVLYITVFRKDADEEENIAYVYALKQDVGPGEEITQAMVEKVEVSSLAAPSDSFSTVTKDSEGKLKDKYMEGGYKSKIALSKGTILSKNMLYVEEIVGERLIEYNMLTLPMDVDIGDYIDIRLSLPNGQDLIVISKKEIRNLFGNTVTLYLTEEEILMMNSAIVEAYIMEASNLYVVEYVEPIMQLASELTYVPTTEVQELINVNPNITNEARIKLQTRFTNEARTGLNNQTSQYAENRIDNIETGIQEQIEAARAAREAYLSGLSGY